MQNIVSTAAIIAAFVALLLSLSPDGDFPAYASILHALLAAYAVYYIAKL